MDPQIVKSSEMPVLETQIADRGSTVQLLAYVPALAKTMLVEIGNIGAEFDRNRRTLKTVTASTYYVEDADATKILLFLFDEGDTTVYFSDGLAETNSGEFILIAGDATVVNFEGDGVSVRTPDGYLPSIGNWGVAQARLTTTNSDAPVGTFATGFFLSGNLEIDTTAAGVASVNTRTGSVTLSDADVPAEVVTVSGTSKTLALSDRGQWQDWTNTAAKGLTVNTDVGGSPGEYHVHNAGATGDLTITATGVTITPPLGGTLVVPPGGVCTLKWRATNSFKLFGETEAA